MTHAFVGSPGDPCSANLSGPTEFGDVCLLADEDPVHLSDLPFGEPLTLPNPAATPRKHLHVYPWSEVKAQAQGGPPAKCRFCDHVSDPAASRRGRLNKNRGNAIEREVGKRLGMARTGQFGGKDDLSSALFKAQVKSGGYFSERQWAWLKSVPVQAGQTALLIVTDTPGPGKRRRAMVLLDLDDWKDLHGEADVA